MSSLITIFKFLKKFIRLMSISRFKCSQNIASLNVLVMLTVVHDILEIIKRGKVEALTDHLNGIDKTNSIKFTHEPDKNGQIPFLDTLITRREDGSIKLLVYRKATHTDQYLSFQSHHPLQHKLAVIRTLYGKE